MALTVYYTDEFQGGRAESRRLLRMALEREGVKAGLTSAEPGSEIEILEGEFGKPYLPGGPEFSVSHSDNYYAVLFSDTPCGLDIQLPRRAKKEAIAKRIFSEREADLVKLLGDEVFYKLWTRREALVKCAGLSVFTESVPELLMNPEEEVICVEFEGWRRAVMDIDFPGLYMALCWTVDDGWLAKREVPTMRRLGI